MCIYFKKETEDNSIGRSLSEKRYRGTSLVPEKMKALYPELNEGVEAATNSYSVTDEFLQYIYSVLVARNHRKIQPRCLFHKFSFTDIFLKFRFIWLWLLIAIMKRCAGRSALQLYRTSLSILILFLLQS